MILTPISPDQLGNALDRFAARLADTVALTAFGRIRATGAERAAGAEAEQHRQEAVAVAVTRGIPVHPHATTCDFNWDGVALNGDTEAYVILHEIAHFLLAPPERRLLVDFGLGPGPDTKAWDVAERAAVAFAEREAEEAEASLLGILWEAALGHPALASFLDQNWLEGLERSAPSHFTAVVRRLCHRGLVDPMNIEPAQSRRPSHRTDRHHRTLDHSDQ